MENLRLYIEFYFGIRKPNINFILNGKNISPKKIDKVETSKYYTKEIYNFDCEFSKNNKFVIEMYDKTDNDLLIIDEKIIDHYVVIREIEINGIKAGEAFKNCATFTHTMSEEWVNMMLNKGIKILPIYQKATELRLNGLYKLKFYLPIWQWSTENTYE
jgi:predicted transcriptional regulator